MQEKRVLMLATLAVAAMIVLVAVFGLRETPRHSATGEPAVWLPQLAPKLDAVSRLHLRSATEAVTLVRGEHGWGVQERDGYPIAFSRLEELLRSLAGAHTVEQKTARPELLDRLGLADIEKPDSKAVLIEGWADGSEPLFRVLVGNEADGRGGRYVRDATNNQAWLIDTVPQPLAGVGDWLDPRMLGLGFERVRGVTRTVPGKEGFTVTRGEGDAASLALAAMPKGKKAKYAGVFDNAARAILGATVEDVKPLAAVEFAADRSALTAIDLAGGLRIEVAALKREDGNWVRFTATAGAGAAAQAAPTATQPAAEIAPAPQPDPAAEAKEINARLGAWAYKVSDYAYEELAKPLGDYLDDDKPAAQTTPTGTRTDEHHDG